MISYGHADRRSGPGRAPARGRWLEAAATAGAPALLALLEVFHPHPGKNIMALQVRTWLTVHYLQGPLFALTALAMVRLVRTRGDLAAAVCRLAVFVFAMSFIVFDTAAGIVVGSLVQIAQASATPAAWRVPVDAIWVHPVLGGTHGPLLAIVGRWALAAGTLAGAASLRRAGRPWAPLLLLALSGCVMEVFHNHSWPGGPLTFGGIAVAAAWLQLGRCVPEARAMDVAGSSRGETVRQVEAALPDAGESSAEAAAPVRRKAYHRRAR